MGDSKAGDTLRGYLGGLDPKTRRFGHAVRKQLERLEDAFLDGDTGVVSVPGDIVIGGQIRSDNYSYTSGNFTNAGSELDLSLGNFRTPGLFVNGATGDVAVQGEVTASEFILLDAPGNSAAELQLSSGTYPYTGTRDVAQLSLVPGAAGWSPGHLEWVHHDGVGTTPNEFGVRLRPPLTSEWGTQFPELVIAAQDNGSTITHSSAKLSSGIVSGWSASHWSALGVAVDPDIGYAEAYLDANASEFRCYSTGAIAATGSLHIDLDAPNIYMNGRANFYDRIYVDSLVSSEQVSLRANNSTGRPYMAFYNQNASGALTRKGFIGYPSPLSSSSTFYLTSDLGRLQLAAPSDIYLAAADVLVGPGGSEANLYFNCSANDVQIRTDSASSTFYFRNGADDAYVPLRASAFTVSSAAGTKRFIRPLLDAMYTLRRIELKAYERVEEPGRQRMGAIAEQVAPILPDAVEYQDGAPDAVSLYDLVALVAAAVKEVDARVLALENSHGA